MAKVNPDLVFNDDQVDWVSSFLQGHMARNDRPSMKPNECAELLNKSGLLPFGRGLPPKAFGFRFREMLRQGKKGTVPMVDGAEQIGRLWIIRRTVGARKPALAGA